MLCVHACYIHSILASNSYRTCLLILLSAAIAIPTFESVIADLLCT